MRRAPWVFVVMSFLAGCAAPEEPGTGAVQLSATASGDAAFTGEPTPPPPMPPGGNQQHCYAVQILHFTHPENKESSPQCQWWEWHANGDNKGWTQKSVPFPVAAYVPGPPAQGGEQRWYVWSAQDVCKATRQVPPDGNNSKPPSEDRLLASIVADRSCAFAMYDATAEEIRYQGRFDKTFLWPGPAFPNSPNRDFRCWSVPDAPVGFPGNPPPPRTVEQTMCALSAGNNVDTPEYHAPATPPPSPTPSMPTAGVPGEAGETTYTLAEGYTLEVLTERTPPIGVAAAAPGEGDDFGLEATVTAGGAYAIVRTRDPEGNIVGSAASFAVFNELEVADSWGPILVDGANATGTFDAPPEFDEEETDPVDDGTDGAMPPGGGTTPPRAVPPGPAHSGGTHAPNVPHPGTPGPNAYHGTGHAPFKPGAAPLNRPKPPGEVATAIRVDLEKEVARAEGQVKRETSLKGTYANQIEKKEAARKTAEEEAAAIQAKVNPKDPKDPNLQALADARIKVAVLEGELEALRAKAAAAETSLLQAQRHKELAEANLKLENELQRIEGLAPEKVTQADRDRLADLVRDRDNKQVNANGGPQAGWLGRLGGVVALGKESPIDPNLPKEVRDRILLERQKKWSSLSLAAGGLFTAVGAFIGGGWTAGIVALGPVAGFLIKAVAHHQAAEALNRGAKPSDVPNPSAGTPPPSTPAPAPAPIPPSPSR